MAYCRRRDAHRCCAVPLVTGSMRRRLVRGGLRRVRRPAGAACRPEKGAIILRVPGVGLDILRFGLDTRRISRCLAWTLDVEPSASVRAAQQAATESSETQPLQDASIPWSEISSGYRTVVRLRSAAHPSHPWRDTADCMADRAKHAFTLTVCLSLAYYRDYRSQTAPVRRRPDVRAVGAWCRRKPRERSALSLILCREESPFWGRPGRSVEMRCGSLTRLAQATRSSVSVRIAASIFWPSRCGVTARRLSLSRTMSTPSDSAR